MCEGLLRPSAGSLSPAYTSELFLSAALCFLLFLSCSLSKKELLPAEAAPLLVYFVITHTHTRTLLQSYSRKYSNISCVSLFGLTVKKKKKVLTQQKQKRKQHKNQIHDPESRSSPFMCMNFF